MLISGDDRRSLTAQRQRAAQLAMSASQQRVQRRAFRQTIHQHDEPHAQRSACLPASKRPDGGRQAPGSGACHTTALRVGADRHLTDASVDEAGLRAAIATLPGAQRQALTEVYFRDRSAAEAARMLQIPVGTVRSRIFYGLRALRRTLAARDAVA